MKKMVMLFASVVLGLFSNAQTSVQSQPDVNIKVTTEYDESGNVIRYDSTYSYSYSGNNLSMFDSIYRNFYPDFQMNSMNFSSHRFMNEPFFSDPNFPFGSNLFFQDFFESDSMLLQFIDPFGEFNKGQENNSNSNEQADGFMF